MVDNPTGKGPKPSRYCGSVERPVAVIVRPWKLPWATMISKTHALVVYYFNLGDGTRHIAGTVLGISH